MFHHRIDHGEEFSHTGHQGHFLRLAGSTQALREGPDDRVIPSYDDGRHIPRGPHSRPPAPEWCVSRAACRNSPERPPLSLNGATPTRAAICLGFNRPTSGNSPSSVRVTDCRSFGMTHAGIEAPRMPPLKRGQRGDRGELGIHRSLHRSGYSCAVLLVWPGLATDAGCHAPATVRALANEWT